MIKEPVKRTSEIEEITNTYFFAPMSHFLVPIFAKLKFTPNMVSLMGMMSGVAAGLSYHYYQDYRYSLLGLFFMGLWHVFDGADGALARLTNSQSEFGKIIDGACDYVVFITVYVSLALAMMPEYGAQIWFVVVGAGLCHAVQSGAYELQRQEFDFWGYGKKSAELPELNEMKDRISAQSSGGKLGLLLGYYYAKMQYWASGLDRQFRPTMRTLIDQADEEQAQKLRDDYRAEFAPRVRRWGIMCANYRTFAIFIACIIKEPIAYFLAEIVLLNILLILFVNKQQRANRAFLARYAD